MEPFVSRESHFEEKGEGVVRTLSTRHRIFVTHLVQHRKSALVRRRIVHLDVTNLGRLSVTPNLFHKSTGVLSIEVGNKKVGVSALVRGVQVSEVVEEATRQ